MSMVRSRTIAVVAAAVATAVMFAGCGGSKRLSAQPQTTATVSRHPANPAEAVQNAFVRVVKNVSPSVVQIETSAGLGSGVVYDGRAAVVGR